MMPKRIAAGAAAFILAAALSGGTDAAAAVLFGDSFEGSPRGRVVSGGEVVATPHGKGLRGPRGGDKLATFSGALIDLDEAGVHRPGGLPRGSISLWVQRDEEVNWENFLGFSTPEFENLGRVSMYWNGLFGGGAPELQIDGGEHHGLWYEEYVDEGAGGMVGRTNVFRIAGGVARGEWMNLTLTWGPTAAECGVYVNGRKLPLEVSEEFGMSRLIADAKYLVIGAQPRAHSVGGPPPKVVGGINLPGMLDMVARSTIDAVEIHDTVVTDFPVVYVGGAEARIASLESNRRRVAGFSGKLVAGNQVDVTLRGTAGGAATFDLAHYPDLGGRITIDWRGWGVYLEDKTFFDAGEVNLRDVEGYRVYASTEPIPEGAAGLEPAAQLKVGEQTYTFELLAADTPYYLGVYAEMRDGSLRPVIAPRAGLPMAEVEPGVYHGTLAVGYGDRFERAVFVGRLAVGAATASLAGRDDAFAVDPRLNIAVTTEPSVLRADEKSTSTVGVVVTNANGDAVSGHKVRFLLATTSQYTGVIGGGAFADQVGGSMKGTAIEGETDLFGRLSATYVAGFAAKTAVIVARDMTSNDTGAGVVRSYIQALAELQLEPVNPPLAAEGYTVEVASSDDWLTADGSSRARITATVKLRGAPVEGHQVDFAVSAGGGTISTVSGTTDSNGRARAVYTAGKKIGIVLITATDVTVDVSGSVQIELRSDAPAKIAIRLTPERLPADGRSRADLEVTVTDINDNPNDGAIVECRIEQGGGRLADDSIVTDRRGEAATRYTAGTSPGTVQISLTVQSPVPTAEELGAARDLAVAVTDYDFF